MPTLQPNAHRTPSQAQVQSMTSQPAPGFLPSRGQGIHAFGGALGQHQTASTLQQQMQSQQSNGIGFMTSLSMTWMLIIFPFL